MPMPDVSVPDDSPLVAVLVERAKQDAKWGEQNHSDPEWAAILMEELGEAARCVCKTTTGPSSTDGANQYAERLEGEVIQVAAVAVAWVEAIRRCRPWLG